MRQEAPHKEETDCSRASSMEWDSLRAHAVERVGLPYEDPHIEETDNSRIIFYAPVMNYKAVARLQNGYGMTDRPVTVISVYD